MGARVGDGVDKTAAFAGQSLRNFHAGDLGDLHDERVGRLDADRMIEGGDFLAVLLDQRQGLFGAIFLHRNGGLGVNGVGRLLKRGAAVIHAVFAVRRGVPHVALVAEDGVFDAHRLEDALDFPNVSDDIAVEAAEEIDRIIRHALELLDRSRLAVPEVRDHALHGVVVAGDVAADEGRGMGEGHVEVVGNRALFLRGLDEGVQIVADHFRHAGGGDRDHGRLVHVISVGQAVDHVVEAAEHRGVFGHRRRDARGRLLEVTREVRTIIRDATLRAMHEGNGLFKAHGDEDRAERLASLGRIDRQSFAGEVQFLVFFSLGPFANAFDFGRVTLIFEHLALVRQHLLVFRSAEQVEMIEHVIGVLRHDFALCCRLVGTGARP